MTRIDFNDAQAGVHSINQFALSVPNLVEEQRFLTTFGLRVEKADNSLRLRAAESDQVWT